MNIYLIRHTEPFVAKGICYGQWDLDTTGSFFSEATIIQQHLPADISTVYSSPLQRCKRLAEHLFPGHDIRLQDDLKEIDCGKWELKLWNDIPKDEIDPWMSDLVNVRIPDGESYQDVLDRVVNCFDSIISNSHGATNVVIVAHGGVIRSILSYITGTPLLDSFQAFSLYYGCVIKILPGYNSFTHTVLSNIAREKETHKPSGL